MWTRRDRPAAAPSSTPNGRLYRHHLFLSAVHGLAALRHAGKAGRVAARGRVGPRLPTGATRAFWSVTLPLSLPGVIAGSFLVFIPAVGRIRHPRPLGGPDTLTISARRCGTNSTPAADSAVASGGRRRPGGAAGGAADAAAARPGPRRRRGGLRDDRKGRDLDDAAGV